MITVRVDDVLTRSSGYDREKIIRQISKLVSWLSGVDNIKFVPTILVSEIQEFPEAIQLIKNKAPDAELHGFKHIDYTKLNRREINSHLKEAVRWFKITLDKNPSVWYTPWGAYSDLIGEEAFSLGFKEVQSLTPSHIVHNYSNGYRETEPIIRPGEAVEKMLKGKKHFPVFCHWYDRGLNLRRIAEICRHGIKEAQKINRDWW